ncbi:MAG: quinone-dependent dihydroorotate dehydrogenase [Pseudomonadota bacterium]
MNPVEEIALRALRCLDPETAHGVALTALRAGFAGGSGPITSDRLKLSVAGIRFPNPVGVAAGFDKNAVAVDATLRTGFGFCEIGAVTPRPQPGNPRPRLFRLTSDQAAINRFGFNNDGVDRVLENLRTHRRSGVIGVNLGANKDTEDKPADYISCLTAFHADVNFATVNVSSPNTERLRDLQGRAALKALLTRVLEARDALPGHVPVFLKIAPDLTREDVTDIAEVCLETGVDAIVATNTTLSRTGLRAANRFQAGGLSGTPLFDRSTRVLAALHRIVGNDIPLIGVGGISSAEDAYEKFKAGASLVQLYTSMVYRGVSLGAEITKGLDALLVRDGISTVTDITGVGSSNVADLA